LTLRKARSNLASVRRKQIIAGYRPPHPIMTPTNHYAALEGQASDQRHAPTKATMRVIA